MTCNDWISQRRCRQVVHNEEHASLATDIAQQHLHKPLDEEAKRYIKKWVPTVLPAELSRDH